MFIECTLYAVNGEERKRERVLTTGWARVCEFLKQNFTMKDNADKVYRARQADLLQSAAELEAVSHMEKEQKHRPQRMIATFLQGFSLFCILPQE